MNENTAEFIPAAESELFIAIFGLYTRCLFWRRFKNIRVHQLYQPGPESKTIYYLNHTSWWDGLIPLWLNRKLFRQNAQAMMEDKQMIKHPFFRKIGAFSVNLEDPRSAIRSMRYAVESIKRENSCLFIYPEGKIIPFSTLKPEFKKGLGWISRQCPDADVVPVGIYIHTAKSDKPELCISIGRPTKADKTLSADELNNIYERELQETVSDLVNYAHHQPGKFKTY